MNMPISVLDNQLNDGCKMTVKPAPAITHAVFYFGPESHWYLNYASDYSGKLKYYLISNANPKAFPISTSSFERQKASNAYMKAQTEIDRISVCVRAMNDRVVHTHMPLADIKEIFGTVGEVEFMKNGRSRHIIYFTENKMGWRLYCECNANVVRSYYLTNLTNMPF
ncbi:MAG: hypothetical protein JSS83_05500 [Cyanobacteria bacterium SZAS LIN-3]|nr:hypothetical protein [Cyanobacteria bacterium SZAS LIN-3]MBS2009427.1 hypothetical protein [Cyanobacteria bacterium SZAS TMP-1]